MKVLLSGCSFSDSCGWGDAGYQTDPRCWYNILANRHQLNLVNVSHGGHSNREIIHRVKQQILVDSYDLIILQLTSTNRAWYWRDDNPLSAVKVVGGDVWDTINDLEKQSLRVITASMNNHINEVERDLTDILVLQRYLTTPLMLVNFANFGKHVLDMARFHVDKSVETTPTILYKTHLSKLANQLDLSNSVGFDRSLLLFATDYATDGSHPGLLSNKIFADIIDKTMCKFL